MECKCSRMSAIWRREPENIKNKVKKIPLGQTYLKVAVALVVSKSQTHNWHIKIFQPLVVNFLSKAWQKKIMYGGRGGAFTSPPWCVWGLSWEDIKTNLEFVAKFVKSRLLEIQPPAAKFSSWMIKRRNLLTIICYRLYFWFKLRLTQSFKPVMKVWSITCCCTSATIPSQITTWTIPATVMLVICLQQSQIVEEDQLCLLGPLVEK